MSLPISILFRIFISSWVSFGSLCFLWNWFILSKFYIYAWRDFCSLPLFLFNVCWVHSIISYFNPSIDNLYLLFVFLCLSSKRLNFIHLLKEAVFDFVIFAYGYSNFLEFCSYIYYFFPSACFWFIFLLFIAS